MQSKAQIDQILRQKCEAKEIPGVVAMAATGNEVIYQGAFGKRDLSKDDADDRRQRVLDRLDDQGDHDAPPACSSSSRASSRSTSRSASCCPISPRRRCWKALTPRASRNCAPAKKPITLRHLMTHTAGFCYDMWNGDMAKYLEKTGTPGITTCQNAALKTPIMTDPGTRWEYGINIDFVGKAVEAASGKRLDAYLRDHMFAPLGMNDTGFKITRRAAPAAGRHACARRGRIAGADPVRARAGSGIPHGRRRPLRHRGRLHQVHPDDPQQGPRQRQPGAEARDGRADGPEPHRRSHHGQDDDGDRRCTPTMSISIPTWSRNGA